MKKRTRAFILLIAALFFITSVAVSALVVWEVTRQSDNDAGLTAQQQAEQITAEEPQEGQLEGTKLEGFEPINNVEKLRKIDLEEGNGEAVKEGGTVTAHYTGALAKDGTIFQSSHDGPNQPFTAPLDGVIQGWQQGIPGMKPGGKRRLIIPAELAYGEQSPSPNIPPNSDLVFDIELIKAE
jgi:FKBP-type peptidyl-prolyl cis-trans isomerase FkpA